MNRKDLKLVKYIIEELNKIKGSGTVLLDTPTTYIAKTNFFLLKGLLDLEDKKGCLMTLDRPHQNMAYLLDNNDINQENIWYIDPVNNLAGEKKVYRRNVDAVNNAFEIEKLPKILEEKCKKRDDFGGLENIDFVLIDNLGPMLNYNNIEKIQEFLRSFKDLIISQDDLIGCLVMDSNCNKELDSIVRDHVKTIINVQKLKEDI